jgi:hypothetical protein
LTRQHHCSTQLIYCNTYCKPFYLKLHISRKSLNKMASPIIFNIKIYSDTICPWVHPSLPNPSSHPTHKSITSVLHRSPHPRTSNISLPTHLPQCLQRYLPHPLVTLLPRCQSTHAWHPRVNPHSTKERCRSCRRHQDATKARRKGSRH